MSDNEQIKPIRKTWIMYKKVTPIINTYITDGLVADFRGEDGYIDGAWIDRVSGYKFTPISTGSAPVHDATNKLYEATCFGGMKADFTTGTNFTLEFVFRDVKNMVKAGETYYSTLVGTNMSGWNMNNGVVINKANDNSTLNMRIMKGTASTIYQIPFTDFEDDELDTFTIVPGVGFFRNGILLSSCGTSMNSGNIGLFTHYDQTYASSYKSKGKIHAVRKYNRALTPEEIMRNYQTDMAIYGNIKEHECITDGLVAYFNGEDDYIDGSWVDRVSGYKFTPVSTNTAPVHDATNKLYNVNQFGGMLGDWELPGTPYTLELTFRDLKNVIKKDSAQPAHIFCSDMGNSYIPMGGATMNKRQHTEEISITARNGGTASYYVNYSLDNFVANELDTITISIGVGFFHNGIKIGDCGTDITGGKTALFTPYSSLYAYQYKSKGKIHSVRYYNRALTAEEIMKNHVYNLSIYNSKNA